MWLGTSEDEKYRTGSRRVRAEQIGYTKRGNKMQKKRKEEEEEEGVYIDVSLRRWDTRRVCGLLAAQSSDSALRKVGSAAWQFEFQFIETGVRGPTQPREDNWEATWKNSSDFGIEN
jgi:hypothetical protein